MKEIKIIHNPRCSKSRKALEILTEKNFKIDIFLYLNEKFSKKDLKEIIKKLKIKPINLMRKKEKVFKELNLSNKTFSDDELIDCMVKHPILIERPIVVFEKKAIIARPPEKLLEII